jgi:lysophospholipase
MPPETQAETIAATRPVPQMEVVHDLPPADTAAAVPDDPDTPAARPDGLVAIASNPIPEGGIACPVTTPDGFRLRCVRWPAPPGPRIGTVVVIQGRAEFIEKYAEVVARLRHRGFAVVAFDFRGQGGSQRLIDDPQRGHARRFGHYGRDLEAVIKQVVLPDCPPPVFGLAHSMGAMVALRSVASGHRWFDRLVLSSPMIALARGLAPGPLGLIARLARLIGLGARYVPGGEATLMNLRPYSGNPMTSDAIRYARAAAVIEAAPQLGLGSPTVSWFAEAARAMHHAAQPDFAAKIRLPVLVMAGGFDMICDTRASDRFARRLHAGGFIELPGSRHEPMQETDATREAFFAAFDAFVPGSGMPGR